MFPRTFIAFALVAAPFALSASEVAQPTGPQIEAFDAALKKAFDARDFKACMALFEAEGVPPATWDGTAGTFIEVLAMEATREWTEWNGVTYLPLASAFNDEKEAHRFRLSFGGTAVNGRKYLPSLPISGLVSFTLFGGVTLKFPVGINAAGELRMVMLKPEKPGDYSLPAPIPPQGVAAAAPSKEALERFQTDYLKALKEGNLLPMFYTKGVPLDTVDLYSSPAMTLDLPGGRKMKIGEVKGIVLGGDTEDAKRALQLRPCGERTYGSNLPYAGVLKIGTGPLDGVEGSGGVMTVVFGMTPSGELRCPLPVPVKSAGRGM